TCCREWAVARPCRRGARAARVRPRRPRCAAALAGRRLYLPHAGGPRRMTTVKLTWIEAKLFLREPLAVIFAFAFPFFVLFVLGGVFGNETPDNEEDLRIWRGVAPTQYYLPAYV